MNKSYKSITKIEFKAHLAPALDILIHGEVFVAEDADGNSQYVTHSEAKEIIEKSKIEALKQ